ncbi:MAG TPA: thioesterase family protein [Candidatus Dormibacteraeota bacterium]
MADLDNDTALAGADGTYRAAITEDWRLLAPSGGFLSALALRAAVTASQFKQPVTYYCHYLNPAEEGEVDLSVTSLRSSRRVESLRVDADQKGRRVAEAMVWTVQPGDGVDHNTAERPDVEPPETYPPIETYVPDWPPFPFWRNFDYRPVPLPGQDPNVPGRAALRTWIRFRPTATFAADDLAAARLVILADTFIFPAAQMAHARWPPPFWGVSLDLAVTIHDPGVEAEWLLVDAETPLASGGVMGGWLRIWSEDGRLLASSVQQMLQRAF